MDDENKTPAKMLEKSKEANPSSLMCGDSKATEMENNTSGCGSNDEMCNIPGQVSSEEGRSTDQVNKVSDTLESISLAESVPESKGQLTLWNLLTCLELF